MNKKIWIVVVVAFWLAAAAGAAIVLTGHHHRIAKSAKAAAGHLSQQPTATVAGATMGWAYNQSPGPQIKHLLVCAEGATQAAEYACVVVVNSKGRNVCVKISFNLSAAGKLKLEKAVGLKNSVCGI